MRRRWLVSVVVVGVLVAAGAASAQNFGAGYIERFFRFEWQVTQSGGSAVMKGYIYNSYGARAVNVRVLAIELDAAAQSVKQTASWVPQGIPSNGRAYFEMPVARADATYQVTLESFDWVQDGKQKLTRRSR